MLSADEPVGPPFLLAASSSLSWAGRGCKLHPGVRMDIHPSGKAGGSWGRISAATLGCSVTLSALSLLAGSCLGAVEERELMDSPCSATKPIIPVAIKREERQSPLTRSICKSWCQCQWQRKEEQISRAMALCQPVHTHWGWITQQFW